MLERILPPQIDNTYRGHKLALWLFALVVAVRAVQSLFIIFNGYSVAQRADGIPLDTFTPEAAQTVVSLFALYSLTRLIIVLLCALALVRYRSAIPFMFALLLLGYLGGQLILYFLPLARTGTPPGPLVNLVTFVLMVVGLALSLWKRGGQKT
jgi:hypothetical protein